MPLRESSDDLARQDVEGRIQIRRPVTPVVVDFPLHMTGLERQECLSAIPSLDLHFFVDREHHGISRWIEVKTADINDFLSKLRIITDLETREPIRLKARNRPDLMNLPNGDAGMTGHQTKAPVRGLFSKHMLSGQGQNLFNLLIRELAGLPGARQAFQPAQSALLKRARHLNTAGLEIPNCCATTLGRTPSASRKMMSTH